MKPFRNRLRMRLLIVALIAAAPAIAAIVVTQSITRQRARELTLAGNLRLVHLAADRQASLFNGARLLLLTLAEVPAMHASDPRACEEMLPNVLRTHPGYLTLAVANADGTLFCSAAPPERRVLANARGRDAVRRVDAQRPGVATAHGRPRRAGACRDQERDRDTKTAVASRSTRSVECRA